MRAVPIPCSRSSFPSFPFFLPLLRFLLRLLYAALALAGAALRTRAVLAPSTSTLAERLIRESTGGAVETARRLHQCTRDTDPALVELGRRLLAAQERTIQEMKRFL